MVPILFETECRDAIARRFHRALAAWPPPPLHPVDVARHNKWNRTAAAVEAWTGGQWTRQGGVDDAPLVPSPDHGAWLHGAMNHPASPLRADAGWNTPDGWVEPGGEPEAVELTFDMLF